MEIEQKQLFTFLKNEGYSYLRIIPGRGVCGLARMLFTYGIVYGLDYYGREGRYCYHTIDEAAQAYVNWSGVGDPSGNWIVHKGPRTGDVQNPNYKKKL